MGLRDSHTFLNDPASLKIVCRNVLHLLRKSWLLMLSVYQNTLLCNKIPLEIFKKGEFPPEILRPAANTGRHSFSLLESKCVRCFSKSPFCWMLEGKKTRHYPKGALFPRWSFFPWWDTGLTYIRLAEKNNASAKTELLGFTKVLVRLSLINFQKDGG